MILKKDRPQKTGDGKALHDHVRASGKTAEEVFTAMGVSNGTFYGYLKMPVIPERIKDKAAAALGLTVAEIFGDTSNQSGITIAPQGRFPRRSHGDSLIEVYDADFEAGTGVEFYDDIQSIKPAYTMDVPDFAGCIAFRNTGKSMEPMIPASSILFATEEKDWKEGVEYGQIFGIVTHNRRKLLKWVRRSAGKGDTHFRLLSANPEFDEMELPKDKIKSMWLIHGWINKIT